MIFDFILHYNRYRKRVQINSDKAKSILVQYFVLAIESSVIQVFLSNRI